MVPNAPLAISGLSIMSGVFLSYEGLPVKMTLLLDSKAFLAIQEATK